MNTTTTKKPSVGTAKIKLYSQVTVDELEKENRELRKQLGVMEDKKDVLHTRLTELTIAFQGERAKASFWEDKAKDAKKAAITE